MAKSPKKNTSYTSSKSAKAPGKTILPRSKFPQQRRFSLIDSDSSSALSEFESEDDEPEDSNQYNHGNHSFKSNKFHAIESESDDDDAVDDNSDDGDDDDEGGNSGSDTNEKLWKHHQKKVVNTSSTSSEGENDSGSESDSSSSDDEDVDFVKLTAERKARHLEQFRSNSPFKSPSPVKDKHKEISQQKKDVDFSFDFNDDDHRLKIANEEEEDVGEELSGVVSPMHKTAQSVSIPGGDALAYPTIDDSSESDGDIDKDELLRTLEQDSDGVEGGFGNGEDEYNLLREEADNILHDYDGNSVQFSSNNVTPRNSIVEEMINKHKAEINHEEVLQFISDDEYADDDDDYDDDDDEYNEDFIIPFFDDSVFKEQLSYLNDGGSNGSVLNGSHKKKEKELDSDDDSYLWDYFFSSGDENDEEGQDQDSSHHFSDDEATDEDTTLPPPSSRKRVGTKAQELLSSSSITARPPALGTWSTDSKPFGIIDGLSTRSLLPGQNKSGVSNAGALSGPSSSHLHQQKHTTPSTPISNNIEELTLDELLNMSELEDDNDEEPLNHDDWLEVTGSNRKVPLSAFRNKGIVNDDFHVNATRRFSSSNPSTSKKLNKKSSRKMNEISMTPVRVVGKHGSYKKRGSKLRRQSMAEAAVEGLRVTKSGLFSEDTLTNVEEFLSGLGSETELSVLFREIQ